VLVVADLLARVDLVGGLARCGVPVAEPSVVPQQHAQPGIGEHPGEPVEVEAAGGPPACIER
jgi:hypothetical protein